MLLNTARFLKSSDDMWSGFVGVLQPLTAFLFPFASRKEPPKSSKEEAFSCPFQCVRSIVCLDSCESRADKLQLTSQNLQSQTFLLTEMARYRRVMSPIFSFLRAFFSTTTIALFLQNFLHFLPGSVPSQKSPFCFIILIKFRVEQNDSGWNV